MVEWQWLEQFDPKKLLQHLQETGKLSDRSLRLFAIACCRHIWHLLGDEFLRVAVEVADRYIDGSATAEELQAAQGAVVVACDGSGARNAAADDYAAYDGAPTQAEEDEYSLYPADEHAASAVYWTVNMPCSSHVAEFAATSAGCHGESPEGEVAFDTAWNAESDYQCHILRCIFGNPFQPVQIDPAWLTPVVKQLGCAAYQFRSLPSGHLDADRFAVLADALEEAGCTDPDTLDHLRGPGPHVRGCWAVDLLSGKR